MAKLDTQSRSAAARKAAAADASVVAHGSDQLAKARARLVEMRDDASCFVLRFVRAKNIPSAEKHLERYGAFGEAIDAIDELIKSNNASTRAARRATS